MNKSKERSRGLEFTGLLGIFIGGGGMFISIGIGASLAVVGFIIFILGRFRTSKVERNS